MAYLVKFKLRDATLTFGTKTERDAAYTKILNGARNLDIPDDNVILEKVDTQLSSFSGDIEEKVVGRNQED